MLSPLQLYECFLLHSQQLKQNKAEGEEFNEALEINNNMFRITTDHATNEYFQANCNGMDYHYKVIKCQNNHS